MQGETFFSFSAIHLKPWMETHGYFFTDKSKEGFP